MAPEPGIEPGNGARAVAASEPSRLTLLVVEDDPVVAALIQDRFQARGYRVCIAPTAAEAEALVYEVRPALVIVDLMLPDTHGLVLCANLREKSRVPIVVCSA